MATEIRRVGEFRSPATPQNTYIHRVHAPPEACVPFRLGSVSPGRPRGGRRDTAWEHDIEHVSNKPSRLGQGGLLMRRGESSCRRGTKLGRALVAVLPAAMFCLLALTISAPTWAQIDGQCDPTKLDSGCPNDGNPCTNDVCDPVTRTCQHSPRICPIDNPCNTATCNPSTGFCDYTPKSCPSPLDNKCSVGSCDPSNGQCVYQPVTCAQDGNLCMTETCNPSTGTCQSGAPVTCPSPLDNKCSLGSCNPSTGKCVYQPETCAQDGNLCTAESCNPSTGACESGSSKTCASDNLCSVGSCNPSTGQCDFTPITCAQDGNLCNAESCNPATGRCESGASKTCVGDSLCSDSVCDAATGNCKTTNKTCAQDDDLCTIEACNAATGKCESGSPTPCTADADICTTEVCDSVSGRCHSVPANPTPPGCGATICRTPGFWGTHAGVEKSTSSNITQAVITLGGGVLNVCGQKITDTVLNDNNSAVEAICTSMKDGAQLQLARQLTAAALNCIVSNGIADCSATPLYSAIFAKCNTICSNTASAKQDVTDCISQIDCLNNGGTGLGNGSCQTGVCAGDGVTACDAGTTCGDGSLCTGLPNNCHDMLLVNRGLGINFE